MENTKSEKFHSTPIYFLLLILLISIAGFCFYFIENTIYRFLIATVPVILLLTAKNTVIELHSEYFLIKNYFLWGSHKKRRYLYDEIAFIHYHRHTYIFLSAFDFWGFYKQNPVEVRYKNGSFETLPIYGIIAPLLRGIQTVNENINEIAGLEDNVIM